jgi:hypothetical protein
MGARPAPTGGALSGVAEGRGDPTGGARQARASAGSADRSSHRVGRRGTTMDTVLCCPACGQPDTLILLGSRDDHPHRWRWWSTALTLLYLCEQCDVLLEIGAARGCADLHDALGSSALCPSSVRPPSVVGAARTRHSGERDGVNESRHGRDRRRTIRNTHKIQARGARGPGAVVMRTARTSAEPNRASRALSRLC